MWWVQSQNQGLRSSRDALSNHHSQQILHWALFPQISFACFETSETWIHFVVPGFFHSRVCSWILFSFDGQQWLIYFHPCISFMNIVHNIYHFSVDGNLGHFQGLVIISKIMVNDLGHIFWGQNFNFSCVDT